MNIKQQLYNFCEEFVNEKLQTIEHTIKSNQNDLASETKSSAGDKHETGRAMLQLEMEKAGQQLQEVTKMKVVLSRLDLSESNQNVRLGSIVKTNLANYFIAVSAGKIDIDNETYFAISSSSPIGKQLLGKTINDEISFNQQIIKITTVW